MKPAHRLSPPTALLCAVCLCLGTLILTGCDGFALADGTASDSKSYTRINRGVRVEAGSTVQHIRSVNGTVRVEEDAHTGDVDSVNGSVHIGDRAALKSLDSVNGAITIGHDVTIENDLSTVNGSMTIGSGTRVGGTLKSVNGSLRLSTVHIVGSVKNYNGSIALLDGCVVEGELRVKKKGFSSSKHRPKIVIGADTQVRGAMVFERPVRLYVHESASVGEVRGAKAERFSGSAPG